MYCVCFRSSGCMTSGRNGIYLYNGGQQVKTCFDSKQRMCPSHINIQHNGDILKAFKSTDAYQYAVAGWVKDAKVRHLATTNLYLIRAKLSTIYL
ncbi:unnamed protein product [Arctogadus glacialis]